MIPCGDKIFVRPDPVPEKTPGGIIKLETAFVEMVSGTVEAVHKGYVAQNGTFVKCQFQVGDKVYYQHGQAVKVEFVPDLDMIMEAAIVMREERSTEGKEVWPKDHPIRKAYEKERKPDTPGC